MTSAIIIGMLSTLLAGGMVMLPGGMPDNANFPTQTDVEAVRTFLAGRADVETFDVETDAETQADGDFDREIKVTITTKDGVEKVLKFEREVKADGEVELRLVTEDDGKRADVRNDDEERGRDNEAANERSGRDGNDEDVDNSGPGNANDSVRAANVDNSGPGNAEDPHDVVEIEDEDGDDRRGRNENELEAEFEDEFEDENDGDSGRR